MSKPSLKQVEQAIKEFNPQEQQHLLKDLPSHKSQNHDNDD